MKLSFLIFISMLVLPYLAFSQQTDNKNIVYESNIKMVSVKFHHVVNGKNFPLPLRSGA